MNYSGKFDSGFFDGSDSFPGTGDPPSLDIQPKGNAAEHGVRADIVVVPDAYLLFSGDYKRSGLDLVLSKDGHELVVRDYFRGENRAALASSDGASLSGKTVAALAGQVDYAQAGGGPAPEQVIGHVTKLTGSATAVRNGVSITLNMGDNVHKGDVVQSGSDSSLGITFIDGTVFGLSSNARMVLNDMIYNPNGSNNSSFLTLVQGTISFVAGATAKHGDMKVETPTATMGIRGTAVLVEIDFDIPQPGVAPPVSFRVLVEPNGVTGEYLLLDKVTLQPIATVNQAGSQTIVNGLGVVTFIQSAQIPENAQRLINEIFTLKFTDNANPKAIGIPPLDSITPQSFTVKLADGTPVTMLPIFINMQGLGPLAQLPPSSGNHRFHLDIPPELVAFGGSFTERLGTGNATLDTVSGIIRFADINPEDLPTATARFDSFVYRNAGHTIVTSSLTLEQLAAISAVEVPLTIIPGAGNTNVGEATWIYSVADGALDFLADGESLTLTYMARVDTNYSEYNTVVFKPFTITITGTNDLPTVAATGSAFIELVGTNNPAIDHAEGVITFADVDLTDRPTVTAPFAHYVYTAANGSPLTLTAAQQSALAAALTLTPSPGNTHNGSVAWSYDVADSNFDFVATGETLVLTYTAIVDDHHGGVVTTPLTVTVTVTGTNDIPTITATSDSFVELPGTNHATVDHAGGTINFTDVDLTDRPTVSAHYTSFTYQNALHADVTSTLTGLQLTAIGAVHPLLSVTPAGTNVNDGAVAWSYDLPDNQFDFLADGEVLTLTYTATVDDHHGGVVSTPITVTVTGTNDAPDIVADLNLHAITELAGTTGNTVTADTAPGSLAFTDVDLTDTHSVGNALSSAIRSGGSSLPSGLATMLATALSTSVTTDGTGTGTGAVGFTFSAADNNFDFLADGETLTVTYDVTVTDNNLVQSTQPVTITIHGTNDDPVVVADASGPGSSNLHAITELAGTTGNTVTADTASGSLAFTDVDLTDTHTVGNALSSAIWSGGSSLPSGLATMLATALSTSVATDSTGTGTGAVGFTYSASDNNFDFLADGETLTITYDVTVTDNHLVQSTQPVTITVTGTNDDPVVAADASGPAGSNLHAITELADTTGDTATPDTASGSLAFTDVDLTDTHTVEQAAPTFSWSDSNGDPLVLTSGQQTALTAASTLALTLHDSTDTGAGSVGFTYSAADNNFDFLADGETLTITYDVTVTDNNLVQSTRPVTITVNGTNDAPDIAADTSGAGGGNVHNFIESDIALTTSGALAASDADVTNTVAASVYGLSVGGSGNGSRPTGLTDTVLQAMLSVDAGNVIDNAHTDGTIHWNFDSDPQAFNFLATGETLQLTYTIRATDSDASHATGDQTVVINITGTNDAPTMNAIAQQYLVEQADTNPLTSATPVTFTDADRSDAEHTAQIIHASASGVTAGLLLDEAALMTLMTPQSLIEPTGSSSGSLSLNFAADSTAFDYLRDTEVVTLAYTLEINDHHGGVTTQTSLVTITGVSDYHLI